MTEPVYEPGRQPLAAKSEDLRPLDGLLTELNAVVGELQDQVFALDTLILGNRPKDPATIDPPVALEEGINARTSGILHRVRLANEGLCLVRSYLS